MRCVEDYGVYFIRNEMMSHEKSSSLRIQNHIPMITREKRMTVNGQRFSD